MECLFGVSAKTWACYAETPEVLCSAADTLADTAKGVAKILKKFEKDNPYGGQVQVSYHFDPYEKSWSATVVVLPF